MYFKDLITEALNDKINLLDLDAYDTLYDSMNAINDLSTLRISEEFTKSINEVKKIAEYELSTLTKYHNYVNSYLRLILVLDKLTRVIPDKDLEDIKYLALRCKSKMFNRDQLALTFSDDIDSYNWISEVVNQITKDGNSIEYKLDTLVIRLKN